MELITRTLISLLIIGAGFLLYQIANRVILARARDKRLGLEDFRAGIPAILYFTTPTCMPCKTVQRPALRQLQNHLGDGIQVIQVDASERPDLADYWGVLSVPTTFIIDPAGEPRRVNHGVTRAEQLLQQIEDVSPQPAVEEWVMDSGG